MPAQHAHQIGKSAWRQVGAVFSRRDVLGRFVEHVEQAPGATQVGRPLICVPARAGVTSLGRFRAVIKRVIEEKRLGRKPVLLTFGISIAANDHAARIEPSQIAGFCRAHNGTDDVLRRQQSAPEFLVAGAIVLHRHLMRIGWQHRYFLAAVLQ